MQNLLREKSGLYYTNLLGERSKRKLKCAVMDTAIDLRLFFRKNTSMGENLHIFGENCYILNHVMIVVVLCLPFWQTLMRL